ncbi:MAG: UvrD-helicase domain-containing protein, partial [Desulfobacterales bacterium]|nr:UvrD-helicase domain-containing protein [Desulfobacterales bacterium]
MRNNQVRIAPGYDGEFGTISLFDDHERSQLLGQKSLFGVLLPHPRHSPSTERDFISAGFTSCPQSAIPGPDLVRERDTLYLACRARAGRIPHSVKQAHLPDHLNEAQQEAVQHTRGPLLIVAGPGTGKTFTLAHRVAYLLQKGIARPEQILAVTFTNKAAQEMAGRLSKIFDDSKVLNGVTIKTFHALCLDI